MIAVNVSEQTEAFAARRAAVNLASELSFNETDTGKVAVVVTEMATNLLKHAGSGQILIGSGSAAGVPAIELLAIDSGPGMASPESCVRDGFSTAGSSGTGLGAIARMSSVSAVYSAPGHGTIVHALCGPSRSVPPMPLDAGGVSVPVHGETECGDAYACRQRGGEMLLMVADGLGHGPGAAEAARRAVETFQRSDQQQLTTMMESIHIALRGTRGAAVAIAAVSPSEGRLRFCGTGNISCALVDGADTRHCVSMHGIVGHQIRTPREFEYLWNGRTIVVMSSDGITNHWDLRKMPGIGRHSAVVIAGAIWRAARRHNDDATALVLKAGGQP